MTISGKLRFVCEHEVHHVIWSPKGTPDTLLDCCCYDKVQFLKAMVMLVANLDTRDGLRKSLTHLQQAYEKKYKGRVDVEC